MKKINNPLILLLTIFAIVTTACKDEQPIIVPEITIEKVGVTKIICKTYQVKKWANNYHGICYSTTPDPYVTRYNTIPFDLHFGDTTATATLTDLQPNTTYFIRPYAVNSDGKTEYGETEYITTKEFGTVADIEGNLYRTIQIGDYTWMATNLDVKKYNDGADVPNVIEDQEWSELTSGALCYNQNATHSNLYNGYAVNSNKICPIGWHVATESEWTNLITNKWDEFTEEEFSVLSTPNQGRRDIEGNFNVEKNTMFWSSTKDETSNNLFAFELSGSIYGTGPIEANVAEGFLVRCVKN